jgi:sulfite reductase (NADPH) hemoprotein beta-component
VPEVIEALINVYLEQRTASERFIDTWQRLGAEPFKARAYAGRDRRRSAKVAARTAKEVVNA